ncbi:hypothetical protein UFOVP658_5 [uncultured Caudovirales phage]|uniref:EAL domain-containing protein n=1 Tax=uncultured Caudovirales phage TaxID=2100421 RepID=A0A6J5NEE2_9CAUD|nr:hypothetical protein UFOVP658_5 [uncultured Caudovirales phage]
MTTKLKYEGPKVSFKHYGSTYVVLTFLKMKKCPVDPKSIAECFKGYFRKASDATKTLNILERNGCATKDESGQWQVTQKGLEVVHHVGRARPESVLIRGFGM